MFYVRNYERLSGLQETESEYRGDEEIRTQPHSDPKASISLLPRPSTQATANSPATTRPRPPPSLRPRSPPSLRPRPYLLRLSLPTFNGNTTTRRQKNPPSLIVASKAYLCGGWRLTKYQKYELSQKPVEPYWLRKTSSAASDSA